MEQKVDTTLAMKKCRHVVDGRDVEMNWSEEYNRDPSRGLGQVLLEVNVVVVVVVVVAVAVVVVGIRSVLVFLRNNYRRRQVRWKVA